MYECVCVCVFECASEWVNMHVCNLFKEYAVSALKKRDDISILRTDAMFPGAENKCYDGACFNKSLSSLTAPITIKLTEFI